MKTGLILINKKNCEDEELSHGLLPIICQQITNLVKVKYPK